MILFCTIQIAETNQFPIRDYFDKTTAAIEEMINGTSDNVEVDRKGPEFRKLNRVCQHNKVVVFCVAGMSRSSAICLAYAIKYCNMTLKEAFKLLQAIRPYARPNMNFFSQLIEYEKTCLGVNSVTMVRELPTFEPTKRYDDSDDGSHHSDSDASEVLLRPPIGSNEDYVLVPDFYRKEYPHLFKLEVEDYLDGEDEDPQTSPIRSTSKKKTSKNKKSKPSRLGKKVSSKQALAIKSRKTRSKSTTINKSPASVQNAFIELKPYVVEHINYTDAILDFTATRKARKPSDPKIQSSRSKIPSSRSKRSVNGSSQKIKSKKPTTKKRKWACQAVDYGGGLVRVMVPFTSVVHSRTMIVT